MSATGHGTVSGLWWAEADVAKLREVVTPVRPVASVYVGGERFGVDAAEDLSLRTRSLLRDLEAQGTDDASLKAVRQFTQRLGPDHSQHAVFVRDGSVLYERTLTGTAPFDRARFAVPAAVTPVLEWLSARPPHVIVVADRSGAEVTSVAGGGGPRVTTIVVGPDDEITHPAPHGWAQPRWQRRAEDAWRHNAAAVVDAASQAARQVGARLILIAGDIRAVKLVREGFDRRSADVRLCELPGGRPAAGSAAGAAAVAIADDARARTDALLRRLRDDSGPVGMATEGAAATLAALAAGRADVLLVVDDPADGRLAWCDEGVLCSLLRPESTPGAVHGRLVDVAVRAALLSDAQVCVLPVGHPLAPAEGIAAICRYPD